MKMRIIDERKENRNTFSTLKVGEWFIDVDGNICLKVDDERGLYKYVEEWNNECFDDSETVIPIEVEVHIIG